MKEKSLYLKKGYFMKGEQIGRFKIAKDFSGNFSRGIIIDTISGEVIEENIQDINFDELSEKYNAQETRERIAAELPATETLAV